MHQSLKNTHWNSSCNQGETQLTHLSKRPAFSNNFIHLIIYFCLNAVNPPTCKLMLFVVQTPNFLRAEPCIWFGTWKGWCLNQSLSKVDLKTEIPGWARWEEWPSHSRSKQAFLIKLMVQTLNFSCTWFNVLGSAHEKIGDWTRPKMQHWF